MIFIKPELVFKSKVVSETAYGVVKDFGVVKNIMKLKFVEGNLVIEWSSPEDELIYTEIGLTIEGKRVIDYDGVFELPKQAIELLKLNGFDLSELEGVKENAND